MLLFSDLYQPTKSQPRLLPPRLKKSQMTFFKPRTKPKKVLVRVRMIHPMMMIATATAIATIKRIFKLRMMVRMPLLMLKLKDKLKRTKVLIFNLKVTTIRRTQLPMLLLELQMKRTKASMSNLMKETTIRRTQPPMLLLEQLTKRTKA